MTAGRTWRADPRTRRWLRSAIWVVGLAALLVFLVKGADRPEDPFFAPQEGAVTSDDSASGRRPFEGFGEVAFEIEAPGQAAAQGCALLAAEREARSRGLMDQRDLRGYEAMVFRFPEPTSGTFYMRDTLIPLSIAFFDADGALVSATDMQPCPDEVEDCPQYAAAGSYLHAVEVAQGDLASLGVAPGASLSFPGGPCPT